VADERYMRRAIELARRAEGFTSPNPMVGCVLVRDDAVVGEGYHLRPGEEHAEAMALRLAGGKGRGATAYVTLEPCNHYGRTPPCSRGLIEAGVAGVVYGHEDPNRLAAGGAAALRAAGIEAEGGFLRPLCRDLIRPWLHSLTSDRPWVTAKLAMSLDGYTALPSGESKWITGPGARDHGHRLRQRTGAIMVGVGTVLADDPALDPRLDHVETAPSVKVVFDSRLRTPQNAKLLASPGPVLIAGHEEHADETNRKALEAAGAEVLLLPGEGGQPDLGALLRELKRRQIIDVMIEGGGRLLGRASDFGVIDEVWAFIAPVILGGGQRAVAGQGLARLADVHRLRTVETRSFGRDSFIRAVREDD
jgi:diaminohydroxyphosphoribosylaminopyrimidine deaminase/5-amino-6-(5-phosphoribosylamino)uracil reductase